ncbi:unnamed protein product, partial [marine sediment metagenome]
MPETITVKVLQGKTGTVWKYRKPDSGWSILKTDKGICKGVVEFEPNAGDMLQLEGTWATSNYDGALEFSFKNAILTIPEDPRALLQYAANITKGIGPAIEDVIWIEYGESWREHDDLTGIPGVGESTRWYWQDTLKRLEEQQVQTQTISFLLGKGCTINLATLAWTRWGAKTYG